MEHEQKVLEILKQKEGMREAEKRINASRSVAYKPSYFGQFYKQLTPNDEENHSHSHIQREKMKQFAEEVKSKYLP